MIASFSQELSQPEYIHVLINPLPVYGLTMGIIALVFALVLRSRPAQMVALALIFVSGAIALPVIHYGEEGYDRVLSMTDEQGEGCLKVHEHRADQLGWSFYVLAGVAAAAMLVPLKWPRTVAPLTIITLVLSFVVLGAGGYIAYAGGKVRHREFRSGPPPPVPVEAEE